ncbi:MAG TPA: fused MFS/spermidine synthase [Streptosporangiaceae bacterium]|jgi:spermidine synthase
MAHRQRDGGRPAVRRAAEQGAVELIADPDRPGGWLLLVDGTPQSHVDLDDPRHLEFAYIRRLAHLADLVAPAGQPASVLHLGGGGLTLARYVAATRPGSGQLAVESHAVLAEVVREHLPLMAGRRRSGAGQRPEVRVRVGDARAVLAQVRAGSFDLVVADLFAGARTPAHLTSGEFLAAAGQALSPDGILAVNVGDGPPLDHARGQVATLRAIFPQACLMADTAVLRRRRFGNLVLAGSRVSLPLAGLARRAATDPQPWRLVHGAELDRFEAGARPVTDASAHPSPAPPPEVLTLHRPAS